MRTGDKLRFCADLMRKQTDLVRQIETRANIVIGLSGAAIAFAINKASTVDHPLVTPVLVGTALLSIVFALMAIKPPRYLSRHGQIPSVFYHTYITRFTQKDFVKEISKVSSRVDLTVEEYAKETFNIVKYSLQFKKRFAHLAITVFTLGIVATVAAWLF